MSTRTQLNGIFRRLKPWIIAALFIVVTDALANSHSNEHSDTVLMIGYDGTGWFPYLTQLPEGGVLAAEDWQQQTTLRNSTHVTRQPNQGDLWGKAENGRLYRYSVASQALQPISLGEVDQESDPAGSTPLSMSVTQLRAGGSGLTMVRLEQGKSRTTQLVDQSWDQIDQALSPSESVVQAGAQFHPLLADSGRLYYAHVSCRSSCDPLIQEIWKKEPGSGRLTQMTLLNATSYLHSVDADERYGYLSSNALGYYLLARLDLLDQSVTWLTEGRVTDSHPSISRAGDLYFIRRTRDGTALMRLSDVNDDSERTLEKVELPPNVTKIRYLEITDS